MPAFSALLPPQGLPLGKLHPLAALCATLEVQPGAERDGSFPVTQQRTALCCGLLGQWCGMSRAAQEGLCDSIGSVGQELTSCREHRLQAAGKGHVDMHPGQQLPERPHTLSKQQVTAVCCFSSRHAGGLVFRRPAEPLPHLTRQACAGAIPGVPLRLPWPPAGPGSPPRLEQAPGGQQQQGPDQEGPLKGMRAGGSRDLKHLFRLSATSSESSEPLITSALATTPPEVVLPAHAAALCA